MEAGGEQEVSIPAGADRDDPDLRYAFLGRGPAEAEARSRISVRGSDYDGGRYAAAAEQLERLLPYAPNSFEIHELLGLVYASLSQDAKARRAS